jgi:hypothetical protein
LIPFYQMTIEKEPDENELALMSEVTSLMSSQPL